MLIIEGLSGVEPIFCYMFREVHLLANVREHSCVQVDIFEIKTFVRPLSLLRK